MREILDIHNNRVEDNEYKISKLKERKKKKELMKGQKHHC